MANVQTITLVTQLLTLTMRFMCYDLPVIPLERWITCVAGEIRRNDMIDKLLAT
jgi:hypothetical protein